jgi:hypothetical protein
MDPQLDYQDNEESLFELNKDIALKALLFGMVFYIIDSKLLNRVIENCLPTKLIEKQILKSILFALIFYIIMSQL